MPTEEHIENRLPKTLRGWLWLNRGRFRMGLVFACLRIVVVAPLPLVFRHIIDELMPAGRVQAIAGYGVATIALLVAHYFLATRGAICLGREIASALLELRGRIFLKIQYLSFGYLDRQKTGRLLSKYAFDTQKIEMVAMPILNNFIPDLLYSAITFSIFIFINWKMAGMLLLILPVFAWLRAHFFTRFQENNEASRIAQERLAGTAIEFFTALRLVRFYGEEKQAENQLRDDNDEVARTRVDLIRTSSSFYTFSWTAIQGLSLLIVAGGAVLSIYGQISTGEVLAFVAGMPALVGPIVMFAHISDQYFVGQEAQKSIRELLEAPYVESWKGTARLPAMRGELHFERVSFRYPEAEGNALTDFDLRVRAGEKIALVGASGAGKTTIANLLLGLYRPDAGTIRVDGVAQEDLDMRWFRRQTAIVLQESILLSGSVRDNLRFARPEASDEEIRDAARMANAESFIHELPAGYETQLGERGATLSGGQRQRLAIARALLRDPRILVLDEPTSALDYESERHIQAALETLSAGRTVLTVAHRLSTIRKADRILVLEKGQLVDSGTYAELSDRPGPFRELMLAGGETA